MVPIHIYYVASCSSSEKSIFLLDALDELSNRLMCELIEVELNKYKKLCEVYSYEATLLVKEIQFL